MQSFLPCLCYYDKITFIFIFNLKSTTSLELLFSVAVLAFPIIIIPDPININEIIVSYSNGRFKKIKDKINVKSGNVIEIAIAIVVPNSFWAVKYAVSPITWPKRKLMNKDLLNKLKEKLEKERTQIEKNLETFADKDKKLEGDWDTRFPKWNGGGSSSGMEIAADEVEEYSTLLSLEHVLEIRLKNIISALKKIKKNKYGICETAY